SPTGWSPTRPTQHPICTFWSTRRASPGHPVIDKSQRDDGTFIRKPKIKLSSERYDDVPFVGARRPTSETNMKASHTLTATLLAGLAAGSFLTTALRAQST